MATYQLTADELLLIYLTFLARDEEGHSEYFTQWFNNGGQNKLRDLFNSLKEKGVILKSYNPERYIPNDIEFNKNFLRNWFKGSGEMGRELFNAYPPFININGKMLPLKDISKKFSSIDDFSFFYATQIKHNPEKHKEIMELLSWAKEHGYINFEITSFVVSNQWKALKKKKNNPDLIPTASNICTIDE